MKQMYRLCERKPLSVCRLVRLTVAFAGLCTLAAAQTPPFSPADFTGQYCMGCHDDTILVAGISFESIDWNNPGKSADTLEKAIRKVGSGEMPPPGMPHPSAAAAAAFTGWLVDALDKYSAAHP